MMVRKKPVEVEAHQWTGSNWHLMQEFIGESASTRVEEFPIEGSEEKTEEVVLLIQTLEGEMMARPGDWIIKGIKGEFYPCKPDIFAETYEMVEGL